MGVTSAPYDSKETRPHLFHPEETALLDARDEFPGQDDAPARTRWARKLIPPPHNLLLVASLVANLALAILLYGAKRTRDKCTTPYGTTHSPSARINELTSVQP